MKTYRGWLEESFGMRLALVAILLVGLRTPGGAQGRKDLPPPDSSRAPLLTRTRPDSIRLQVRQLALTKLLGQLQRADGSVLDAEWSEVELGPGDRMAQMIPLCSTLGTAVVTLRSRSSTLSSQSEESNSIAADFRDVAFTLRDTVRARMWILAGTGREITSPVLFVWDSVQARWAHADGLLSAVCAGATAVGR